MTIQTKEVPMEWKTPWSKFEIVILSVAQRLTYIEREPLENTLLLRYEVPQSDMSPVYQLPNPTYLAEMLQISVHQVLKLEEDRTLSSSDDCLVFRCVEGNIESELSTLEHVQEKIKKRKENGWYTAQPKYTVL